MIFQECYDSQLLKIEKEPFDSVLAKTSVNMFNILCDIT